MTPLPLQHGALAKDSVAIAYVRAVLTEHDQALGPALGEGDIGLDVPDCVEAGSPGCCVCGPGPVPSWTPMPGSPAQSMTPRPACGLPPVGSAGTTVASAPGSHFPYRASTGSGSVPAATHPSPSSSWRSTPTTTEAQRVMTISDSTDGRPLQFFPVDIGVYLHHPGLETDPEIKGIEALLKPFGAQIEPWPVPPENRGIAAVTARLKTWSAPQDIGDTVLYWVGHGVSDGGPTALLAHAHSPRPVTPDGIDPPTLLRHIKARQGRNGAAGPSSSSMPAPPGASSNC
ncbi:hypothetical protein ACFQ51_07085 [Streptomyces kaempferi]